MDTPIDEERNKEYFNLNGYYLKVSVQKEQITIIVYNSTTLNGIRFETTLSHNDISKIEKIKSLSPSDLFESINSSIEDRKLIIKEEKNSMSLYLMEGKQLDTNKDLQIPLHKSAKSENNEYTKILSNIIGNLREENKSMKNDINEMKKVLYKLNNQYSDSASKKISSNDNSNIPPANNSNTDIRLRGNAFNPPSYKGHTHNNYYNNINNNFFNNYNNINNNNNYNNNLPQNEKKIPTQNDKNPPLNSKTENERQNSKENPLKNSLTISSLAKIQYGFYPEVTLSQNSCSLIAGYGANTYNGIVRKYNEDRIKAILDYKIKRTLHEGNGNTFNPTVSYFGIYDGHGGEKCCDFLQNNLHTFILESNFFPNHIYQAISEAYDRAEREFRPLVYDETNAKLLDKSGSCALSAIIMDDNCFITFLGDSRGLYSLDGGNYLYQITRDHKPNDPLEMKRIVDHGGKVYRDERVIIKGQTYNIKDLKVVPPFPLPYRVYPGNLSVS